MDRTFVICKPDAVERGLVGEIITRIEKRSLRIVAMEMRTIDVETARKHYAEHVEKGFYPELEEFITRGPSVLMAVEGPSDTWKVLRTMMGATNPADSAPGGTGFTVRAALATNPADSAPGTIRGDLGILFTENLIHGSDSAEAAARELGIFFPGL